MTDVLPGLNLSLAWGYRDLPQLWMDPIHGLAVSIRSSLSGLSGGPIFTTGDLQKERLSWRTPEKSIRFRGFTVPIVAGLRNRW
jgi:hypothetical protein